MNKLRVQGLNSRLKVLGSLSDVEQVTSFKFPL
jgi:hypothetical protein